MESIKLKSRIGEDGILQVQVPDSLRNCDLEIMVIFQPVSALNQQPLSQHAATSEARGWNPGFFEEVIGGWQGEPLQRPPQLPYEVRSELDCTGE